MNPKHGFLLAAAEWFHHCVGCEPCQHHLPDCEDGRTLYERMKELGGEET